MAQWVRSLDEIQQHQVRDLVDAAALADGVAPVGEQVLRELTGTRTRHLVAEASGRIAAYLNLVSVEGSEMHNDTATAELVVAPAMRRQGLGRQMARQGLAAGGPSTRIWAHGNLPAARALAAELDLVALRRLHQMCRTLDGLPPIPDHSGITLRRYHGAQDDSDILRVNNAAFSWHPEQGGWTVEDLHEGFAQRWFDPDGLFLACESTTGALLGFHWTKEHLDAHGVGSGVGEVYVVGVDPNAQGRGLGHLLTLVGLHHLADRGLDSVILYVEADNSAAVHTYERLGFSVVSTDVAYGRAHDRQRQ